MGPCYTNGMVLNHNMQKLSANFLFLGNTCMMRHHGRFYNFLSKIEYQQFKKSTDVLHDKPGRSNYAEGVIQRFRDLTQ